MNEEWIEEDDDKIFSAVSKLTGEQITRIATSLQKDREFKADNPLEDETLHKNNLEQLIENIK